MKHHQTSTFQLTNQALEKLKEIGIFGAHQAAKAVNEGNLDMATVATIKTAFGTVPFVRKALTSTRSS